MEFVPDRRKFQSGDMPQMMKESIFGVADFWIPLENGTILLTGKNLDGEEKNRVVAAGLFIVNVAAGKIVKIIKGAGKVIGQLGNNIISSVTGDIRKFSEYALTNPSKKGLFVDSWGYKLDDAQKLLDEYTKQAIEAIKTEKLNLLRIKQVLLSIK